MKRVGNVLFLGLCMLVAMSATAGEGTNEEEPRKLEERNLWRFEFANDGFVHTDNAFTSGWSLQRHSQQHDGWAEIEPSTFSSWISRTIPGLGDRGDRIVKRASGLTQVIMTPEDISNPEPQPGDWPWAGALGWSESWYAYDNDRLNAFQIYVGILGPWAMAEQFQVPLHDLINADEPLGWDNQLESEPLVNLNYALKRKLVSGGEYDGGFGTDMALGGKVGLGNFSTFADMTLEVRIGWGLPRGFVQSVDPPGRGIMLDPVVGVANTTQVYFSVKARVSATLYTVFLDGNSFGDSPHPGVDYDRIGRSASFGFHIARKRWAAHFVLNTYDELPFESVNPLTDMSWGNVTLEYRF
jgi:hypothetical protein